MKLHKPFWNTYVLIGSIRSESILHYHFHLLFDTIRLYSRQLTDSKVALTDWQVLCSATDSLTHGCSYRAIIAVEHHIYALGSMGP